MRVNNETPIKVPINNPIPTLNTTLHLTCLINFLNIIPLEKISPRHAKIVAVFMSKLEERMGTNIRDAPNPAITFRKYANIVDKTINSGALMGMFINVNNLSCVQYTF